MEGYENMKWFELTDEAKNQMSKMMSKNPDKYAITLVVNGGGCAGFKYDWKFIDDEKDIGRHDGSSKCAQVQQCGAASEDFVIPPRHRDKDHKEQKH